MSAGQEAHVVSALLEIAAQVEKSRQILSKIYDRLEVTNEELEEIANTLGRRELEP